jgi:hypothetical protein
MIGRATHKEFLQTDIYVKTSCGTFLKFSDDNALICGITFESKTKYCTNEKEGKINLALA